MTRKVAVYTLVTQNHFHFALALMESIAEQKWEADTYVFLVDGDTGSPDLRSEMFTTVCLEDLFPEPPLTRLFRYTAFEMVVSIKPMAMEYLLRQGYDKVIFLDADILVLGSVDPIVSSLDRADIVFTPHMTEPVDDGLHPDDLDIIKAGTLNTGFFGARASDNAVAFLKWWQGKLVTQCLDAPEQGLCREQKWCDPAPSLFSGVLIDRSPGLNVAYWNLAQRDLTKAGSSYFVGNSPVTFFHFSGIVPENPSILSRYDGRFSMRGLSDTVSTLLKDYIDRLRRNGLNEYRNRPYQYDFFSDESTLIPPEVRRMYRKHDLIREIFGADPFDISKDPGFRITYNKQVSTQGPPLTWLAYEIYAESMEVRIRFPHVPGLDTRDYLEWLVSVMSRQYRLSEAFLEPIRSGIREGSGGILEPILRTARKMAKQARAGGRDGTAVMETFSQDQGTRDSESSISKRLALRLRGTMRSVLGRCAGMLTRTPLLKKAAIGLLGFVQAPPRVVAKRMEPSLFESKSSPPALNVVGMLKAQTGLGESARSTIRCATAAGLRVFPVNLNLDSEARLQENIPSHVLPDPLQPRPINVINMNGNLFHAIMLELGDHFMLGRYNIAFWVWEMRYFPPAWRRWLPCLNEIWTPSTFSQEALSRGADVPVVRIPHAVNPEVPSHLGRSDLGLPEDGFIFLFSMDFHSVSERKNPEAVLEAFTSSFGRKSPNVYLCLKLNNPHHRPDVMKGIYDAIQGCDNIIMMQSHLDRLSMNALINVCDCFVSLHRSEGFGLPIAEAMALGKPVIATGWSGNMDFMNVGNSFPVQFDLVELSEDIGPFQKGHSWAEADVNHAAQLMRDLAANRDLAEHIGRRARDQMRSGFSCESVGRLMRDRIHHLLEIR